MTTAVPTVSSRDHPPLALIVDHDADTRRMYSEFLRSSACVTEEAEDGREALAKALSRRPDIIITEIRLPGLSGLDLCQLLRQDAVTRATPIIVVTGDGQEHTVRHAESAGADAVLVKPCLPDQVLETVRKLLTAPGGRRHTAKAQIDEPLERFDALPSRSQETTRRAVLSRAHVRQDTTTPPAAPPILVCPACDLPLAYQRSHVGGVSERHQEQWDYFQCQAGCGTFQYRQRTRKLRRVL